MRLALPRAHAAPQGLSPELVHATLRAATWASGQLRADLEAGWLAAALSVYVRGPSELPPRQLTQVPGVLLALRRVPPLRWQQAFAGAAARAMPRMRGADVEVLLRDATRLNPGMGGALARHARLVAASAGAAKMAPAVPQQQAMLAAQQRPLVQAGGRGAYPHGR